jgi:hypothetical protein
MSTRHSIKVINLVSEGVVSRIEEKLANPGHSLKAVNPIAVERYVKRVGVAFQRSPLLNPFGEQKHTSTYRCTNNLQRKVAN